MRSPYALALAVAAGLGIWLAAGAPAGAQPKPPADFQFPKTGESPGTVTFSHARHKEAGVEKCAECHTKVFKFKKGTSGNLTMAKINAGESCGTCHNGKKTVKGKVVFATNDKANCEKCHTP